MAIIVLPAGLGARYATEVRRLLPVFVLCLLIALPLAAWAAYQPIQVQIGTGVQPRTVPQIIAGIVDILHGLAIAVATTTFLIGGIYVVASGGRENVVQNGKSIMKASLIGIAIILGSWMILSTFLAFLQPAP